MKPVSSLDAAMLYAETPEMPMHTMGVLLLEPPRGLDAASGELDSVAFDLMRRMFEERLHLFPTLRRRLVQGPLQIGDPHWLEDPDFDIDKHLLRTRLPSPGGMSELLDFVGDYAGACLDRHKPLWEVVMVGGLEDGKIAVVNKFHHAAMDGGRLVALVGHLFDLTPEGTEPPPSDEPWTPDREPTTRWLAADTLRTLAGKPRRAATAAAKVASAVRRRGGAHQEKEEQQEQEAQPKPRLLEAPPTPFNGALTPHRSVALCDVALDDVKTIKRAFGTSINDVVLAACCASLRSWLLAHGGLPERPLVVNVPVAVRSKGEDDSGNRVSIIRAHLPIQSDDPAERLATIHEEMQRRKERHKGSGGRGGDVLKDFADILTNVTVPWLLTHLMAFYSSHHLADYHPFFWNLVISNVPGPQVPLYYAGSRLTRIYPLGPVQQGSGLDITVMSTVDRLCFGAMACKELVPDVRDIASGFVDEIATLRALS